MNLQWDSVESPFYMHACNKHNLLLLLLIVLDRIQVIRSASGGLPPRVTVLASVTGSIAAIVKKEDVNLAIDRVRQHDWPARPTLCFLNPKP